MCFTVVADCLTNDGLVMSRPSRQIGCGEEILRACIESGGGDGDRDRGCIAIAGGVLK